MILLTAVVTSVLLATAIYLMLAPDLFKVAAGTVLLTNGAILFLVGADLGSHEEAIFPITHRGDVSDPLAQSLVITAIVIGFGITALLLRIALAVEREHGTIDLEELRRAEALEHEDLA
jgi:multicomponent Na+:H+ antiporter subunit C